MTFRAGVAATTALAAALMAPATAAAAEPIMRLTDVRPGMTCEGRTVVRGTAISRFQVQVIDVVTGDPQAVGPRILVRASGPAVDDTGLGFGFSGSPIYCRDGRGTLRNIGAFSEGVGEYGNEVGLATPIEEVLSVPSSPPAGESRRGSRAIRSARPLDALTVTGLPTRMRRAARRGALRAGRSLIAVPGRPFAPFGPQRLVPGASVAASVSDGDVGLSAVGTVTYRDGARVWAFGHELDAVGNRSLFLQDAYVFTVISNPNVAEQESTYKLASPGHTLGTLTNDTFSAVAGNLGPQPSGIGLRVTARNRNTGKRFASNSRVADENQLPGLAGNLGLTADLALGQAAAAILRSSPPRLAGTMCLRVRVAQRNRRLGFCGRYFDGKSLFEDLAAGAGLVEGYEFGRLDIEDASVRLRLGRGAHESIMLRGRARKRVRRGGRVRVRLALQRVRGRREKLTVVVRVPRGLRPGRRTLTLRGTPPASLEEGLTVTVEQALRDRARGAATRSAARSNDKEGDPEPRTLGQLAAAVASLGGNQGLTATFGGDTGEQRVSGEPERLIRGKIRVPVRVVRGRRARRR